MANLDIPGGLGQTLPDELGSAMREHCERAYPEEACGLLFGAAGRVGRVEPVRNLRSGGRSARSGFEMDLRQVVAALKGARARGDELVAVYHSHPDGGAFLSCEDASLATDRGALLWPGVRQVVLSVRQGLVSEVRWFSGDGPRPGGTSTGPPGSPRP